MQTEAETQSALARKLALAQDDSGSKPRSILRALRLGLARVADDTLDLAMSVIGATQMRRTQDELPGTLAEDRLYLVFAASDDQLGAACVDLACVSSVIQQQTMGQVLPGAVAERPYTGTDAAMIAPVIEAALSRAQDLAEAPADRACLTGYEFCSRIEDLRSLLLTLEADVYRVFDLTLEIAGGTRQGAITLVLPDRPEPEEEDAKDTALSLGRRLDQAAGVMRADLTAVISRVQLPLSVFAAMKPGDLLPLIGDQLDRTELIAIDGQKLSTCRLGQCRGMRAVRLNEKLPEPQVPQTVEAEFTEHQASPAGNKPGPALSDPHVIDHSDIPQVQTAPEPTTDRPAQLEPDIEGALAAWSPDQAAAEITELAGLSGSEE
ncbi:MAG: FliM/FliN family flagellar motor C-terminal domain-containing protein [Ruegeria sp.]|uniref:FliM/FliN family flagellar motor C-terminal domain-containing protein n=1 Tax=Ruegeria sp. TaxID=1879320 RepID=UPI00349E9D05